MSSDALIRVEGVSKRFVRSLRKSMRYGVIDIARDLVGLPASSDGLRPGEFWAVDDVSFEVKRGECLGLIGPNGAGKSTILKMLNGIIQPDKGQIEMRGRSGALIEIGAGFHLMLTGRENIYINGSIMGLSKKEIDAKFDSIVEFSELEEFIDTPVKFYSSGMYVRLGFAVAAHLEPDIMLIDEILAVGDVGFRAKCYNRIAELLKKCAVIFVSHSMPIVGRTCSKCMVMNQGHNVFQGATGQAIQHYLSAFEGQKANIHSSGLRLANYTIQAEMEDRCYILTADKPLEIDLELNSEINVEQAALMLHLISSSGEFIAEWNSWLNGDRLNLRKGCQRFHISLDPLQLNPGTYQMSLIVTSESLLEHLLWIHCGWTFRVVGEHIGNAPYQIRGSISKAEKAIEASTLRRLG